ncbi:MAG: Holliday junction branch migration protein RuvA [Candidatus Marinimicrobia bacterium]|nr:Holliday junction branch migration protein RuvA [Candidatus Neomarinimicrobiota bacterium]MCF7827448.1 Holliday junction branch migration protein RuvA [Candidatus Neomarinimicrobiota bacterium]MCF7882323.1 Holliday junction branch migration protein RuvA [Candidatus Neomarinimicrobiota bacterium]
MYEYIKGPLVKKSTNEAVVDIQGVGYALEVSLATYEQLPDLNKECHLWTYLYVREDAQRLYGFATENERELFLELTSVSGIGPKVAIGILSGGTVQEVKQSIVNEDVKALKRFPGIGPKTAKRVILELRESLATDMAEEEGGEAGSPLSSLQKEGVLALESLGYSHSQAEKAVRTVLKNDGSIETVETLIKQALNTM